MTIAYVSRPMFHESSCGDQGADWLTGEEQILALADGLGHGPEAESAAKAALEYLDGHLDLGFEALFAGCDAAIRKTRGVALEVVRIGLDGLLRHAGIGNTQARIWSPRRAAERRVVRLSGDPGIVGGGYRRLRPNQLQLEAGDLVILYSDGIQDKFDPAQYDYPLQISPAQLAGQLLNDWAKYHDDAAIMIYRQPEAGQP